MAREVMVKFCYKPAIRLFNTSATLIDLAIALPVALITIWS